MQIEIVNVFIITGITLIVALLAYLLVTNHKKAAYDKKNQNAILEGGRDAFEKQIYAINERLIQSEERWRDVNHLLLRKEFIENRSALNNNRKIYYSEFLKANGISESELNINSRLIFVLTPFNNRFYNEYMIIKEVCSSSGYTCLRGDEQQFKGDIFPEMLRYIVQAKLVIANINGRNPNVLYELGVAQTLDKAVLLLSREPKDLPVDIRSQKFLVYSDSNDLSEKLKEELKNLV